MRPATHRHFWLSMLGLGMLVTGLHADSLRLVLPAGYLPSVPVLVRVEALDEQGLKNRDLWDAEAVLETDTAAVTLSTNRVVLKNGLGSALVTVSGAGPFQLTASLGALRATRAMSDLTFVPVTSLGGSLPLGNVTWSGVVRITNDVTVPVGGTLTVQPGTLILLNGVSSGTTAPDILVNGTLQCLGTEAQPVTITCANAAQRWGQIRHTSAQPSLYRHTVITRGGRATGEGHTGTGPVIRSSSSQITFEHCSLTDHAEPAGTPGKVMYALDSVIAFDDCLLARSRMGPEVAGTSMVLSNSWLMEMRGPDDSDAIYIHAQNPGQVALLSGCVIAGGDDDGLDTLGSDVTVENCIIRDWTNPAEDAKGISVFHGETTVRGSVIVNCYVGISAKSSGPHARVNVIHSVVTGLTRGIAATYKANATVGNILFLVTNTIVQSVDAVYTDFGATNFNLGYCHLSESWPGIGNLLGQPLFVDPGTNYHLQLPSPCIDAGDPADPLDPDGTRADIGVFAFRQDQVLPLGTVVFQEIMYHPVSGGTEPAEMEFVELYNASPSSVPLFDAAFPTTTWRLGGAVEFTFPTNTVLPAYRTLLVVGFDPGANPALLEAFRAQYGLANTTLVYGPFAGRLGNYGGTVVLYRLEPGIDIGGMTAWTPLDRVTYSAVAPWPVEANGTGQSLQRFTPAGYGNWPTNWYAAAPAAGSAHQGDSDQDGMPDSWEQQHGLDPLLNDAGLDPDGDQFNNLQEYIAGTDPQAASSALALLSVVPGRDGTDIRFEAVAGHSYTLLQNTTVTGAWLPLTNLPPQAATAVLTIRDPANSSTNRFYRLVTPALP